MKASSDPRTFLGVRSGDAGDRSGQKTTRAKRVLIVDDHNLFRAALGLTMELHDGFKTVQAGSLAEAHSTMRDPKISLNVAVIDLDLLDAASFELIAELGNAEVPVLALTTTQDPGRRTRALEVGAEEVLTTTVPLKEIIATVLRLSGT